MKTCVKCLLLAALCISYLFATDIRGDDRVWYGQYTVENKNENGQVLNCATYGIPAGGAKGFYETTGNTYAGLMTNPQLATTLKFAAISPAALFGKSYYDETYIMIANPVAPLWRTTDDSVKEDNLENRINYLLPYKTKTKKDTNAFMDLFNKNATIYKNVYSPYFGNGVYNNGSEPTWSNMARYASVAGGIEKDYHRYDSETAIDYKSGMYRQTALKNTFPGYGLSNEQFTKVKKYSYNTVMAPSAQFIKKGGAISQTFEYVSHYAKSKIEISYTGPYKIGLQCYVYGSIENARKWSEKYFSGKDQMGYGYKEGFQESSVDSTEKYIEGMIYVEFHVDYKKEKAFCRYGVIEKKEYAQINFQDKNNETIEFEECTREISSKIDVRTKTGDSFHYIDFTLTLN